VLKLFPKPTAVATALVAIQSPAKAVALLSHLRSRCGDRVTGYELLGRICIELVLKHMPATRDPFNAPHPWYVLVELSDNGGRQALDAMLEESLAAAAEASLVDDAAIAASETQARAFWKIREDITEAQKLEAVSVKHDVSVPVSRVPELIEGAGVALAKRFPGVRIVAFGHVGDGNIHYNVFGPVGERPDAFFAKSPDVNRIVYDVVAALGGSISAEHGLGVLKRDEVKRYKGALELELMRRIKSALDPRGLMNPGKVL
jgi:FAD/FMN-containing dehydrogenase